MNQPTSFPQLFNTLSFIDIGNQGWVMDTGATDHVHADSGIRQTVSDNHGPRSVLVGDGSHVPVTNSGHTTLATTYRTLHLNHILTAPKIIKNLISIVNLPGTINALLNLTKLVLL